METSIVFGEGMFIVSLSLAALCLPTCERANLQEGKINGLYFLLCHSVVFSESIVKSYFFSEMIPRLSFGFEDFDDFIGTLVCCAFLMWGGKAYHSFGYTLHSSLCCEALLNDCSSLFHTNGVVLLASFMRTRQSIASNQDRIQNLKKTFARGARDGLAAGE